MAEQTSGTATGMRRVLGMPALVVFGLAYMVPLTVFTTYGVVTESTDGHLPGAYVVTLVAMLFTASSYGRMARVHPFAGSAYTYTQQSFGRHAGFLVGWALLLDYVFLPMINYLVVGIYLNAQFPAVPGWVFLLAAIVLVTGLNVIGIRMVTRMNLVLIGAQAVFVVVFLVQAFRVIAGDGTPSLTEPFFGGDTSLSRILGGAAILCLSFLGFDAISTLAEETREPRRLIPRAIMATTLIGGALFILISYAGSLAFPHWQRFSNVDSASLDVLRHIGGGLLTSFFTAAYVAGAFASAMASQASVSRILYAMGRDGVLPPRLFGRLSARFKTPAVAILLVGLVSCVALGITLDLASAVISFGALAAFSFVNLSVIKHYLLDGRNKDALAWLRYGLVPAIGVALTGWLWTSLSGITFVIGGIWVAIGIAWLSVLTRGFRRPAPKLELEHAG
ncbi:APC family permease [Sciscionella sediminilitoris]|uniref:APC family permease n=1 Tax=Sciscionella sediminilitoris TaxID=1445613 RepID=UPI0004DF678E|nr:APC family permease [Sciscionella sp. SE31]